MPEREPEPAPAASPPPADPPSLRAEIKATRDAVKRLVGSHVELAKAEVGEILGEVKRVAALVGIAIAAGIAAGLLLAVGLPLFLGEWIFGSIGWGILHGLLLLIAVAVAAIVSALGVGSSAIGRAFVVGLISGVAAGIVLGLNLTNRGWGLAGDTLLPLSDPGSRPLATALVVLPIVAAVLSGLLALVNELRTDAAIASRPPAAGGRLAVALPTALYVGWLSAFVYSYSSRVAWPDLAVAGVGLAGLVVALLVLIVLGGWRPGFALISGLAIGIVLGVILAGLTALGLGRRVGAAIGVTIGLTVWTSMMVAEIARRGVDGEELMKRFIPQKTIDITKETIEWVRARMPLSRKS
jgi:hypothetical protein